MRTIAQDTKEESLRKLSSNVLSDATVQARMSGELVLRHNLTMKLAYAPGWLQNMTHPDQTPQQPQLPTQLGPFNSGPITFDNGVPVGGSMSLGIYQDGSYSFSGHFHDSGAPSYDVDGVWVIVSDSGKAFTFEVKGHLNGTFESGSRDFDFAQNGQNDAIQEAWADLCAGYTWRWSAYVNWDAQSALDDLVNALKVAGAVIGAVVAVVAAF